MPRRRNKVILTLRIILVVAAIAMMSSMLWAWMVRLRTTNVSQVGFEPLRDHNGYIPRLVTVLDIQRRWRGISPEKYRWHGRVPVA
jgi:hypothetical protein